MGTTKSRALSKHNDNLCVADTTNVVAYPSVEKQDRALVSFSGG
jgi:hypothetical protein